MNSSEQIKKFLITLAASFPGDNQQRANIYFEVLRTDLSNVDLQNLFKVLLEKNEFFPTAKEIFETIKPKEQGSKELAAEFVDTMLSLMQAGKNTYEIMGSENYNFWKNTIGITRFDLANNPDLKFRRGEWIDRIEKIYESEKLKLDSPVKKEESKVLIEGIFKKSKEVV